MKPYTFLVIDDHAATLDTLSDIIRRSGHEPVIASTGSEGLAAMREKEIDIVFTDLRLPDVDGLVILDRVLRGYPGVPVVLITGHGNVEVAVNAMRTGATDFIEKPVDLGGIRGAIARAARDRAMQLRTEELERRLRESTAGGEMVGSSQHVRQTREEIKQVAGTNATVLIVGESGTGKEMVANAVYAGSTRRDKPFIKVAVAALPRDLLESELFGHEKGAFTSAIRQKKGRFERADGGTLFLDEIGELPPETQVKLLRVLEQREFERVGGTQTITVDIRLIAATNADLKELIAQGRFREDLYFRLNVITIALLPLRERREDIPLLVDHFLKMFPSSEGKAKQVTPEAMAALVAYDWPGNVREVRNLMEKLSIVVRGDAVEPRHLPAPLRSERAASPLPAGNTLAGRELEDVEKEAIAATLDMVGWNKTRAAKLLGIGLKTLYRKIERYAITADPGGET